MRRIVLLLAVAVGLVLAEGAAAAGRDGLFVFTRVGPCPPSADCYAEIYAVATNGAGAHRLTGGYGEDPVWSPDGSRIAYVDDLGVAVVDADGSAKRRLLRNAGYPAWSPDGRQIATAWHYEVSIINLNGTRETLVLRTVRSGVTGLDWSPDGKQLAAEVGFSDIYVVGVDGKGLKLIARRANYPRWSPDGKTILFHLSNGSAIYVVRPSGGAPRLIARMPKTESVFAAAWSADGTQIAYASHSGLHILDLASKRDHLIDLRPPVCTRNYTCQTIDWQRLG